MCFSRLEKMRRHQWLDWLIQPIRGKHTLDYSYRGYMHVQVPAYKVKPLTFSLLTSKLLCRLKDFGDGDSSRSAIWRFTDGFLLSSPSFSRFGFGEVGSCKRNCILKCFSLSELAGVSMFFLSDLTLGSSWFNFMVWKLGIKPALACLCACVIPQVATGEITIYIIHLGGTF